MRATANPEHRLDTAEFLIIALNQKMNYGFCTSWYLRLSHLAFDDFYVWPE